MTRKNNSVKRDEANKRDDIIVDLYKQRRDLAYIATQVGLTVATVEHRITLLRHEGRIKR